MIFRAIKALSIFQLCLKKMAYIVEKSFPSIFMCGAKTNKENLFVPESPQARKYHDGGSKIMFISDSLTLITYRASLRGNNSCHGKLFVRHAIVFEF